MTPTVRTRRRRSAPATGAPAGPRDALGAWATTALLALILLAGPLLLGATPFGVRLPLDVVVALLFVLQGVRLIAQGSPGTVRRIDAIDISALLFVFYAVARWLTSPAEYFSRVEIVQVAACAGVFLTCRYGMRNRSYCMLLLYLLVGLGTAEAIAGYEMNLHPEWSPGYWVNNGVIEGGMRWLGTYESPNHFACFLVMAMSAALALGGFSKLPWPARIVLIYGALVMIVGILWSGSRGGWLAFAAAIAGLVTMGVRNGTLRWWWPVAAGSGLAGVALLFFFLSPVAGDRVAQSYGLVASGNLGSEPRFDLLRNGILIARNHPIFGTGPATFEYIYPHYRERQFDFYVRNTHNDYLNCLDDYGLVGLGIGLFFVVAVSLKFFRPLEVDHRWQDRTLIATGFAVWLALLVHSLVDYNLHVPANSLIFFALVGLALGRFRREHDGHWSTLSLGTGRWLGATVSAVSLLGAMVIAGSALSAIEFQRAFMQATSVPVEQSVARAEQALHHDSDNEFALMFLGNLHRFEAGHAKTAEEKIRDGQMALVAYQKALDKDTINDVLLVRVGMALDLVGKYREALPYFEAACAAEPKNGRFCQALGDHYAACGMTAEAAQYHQRVWGCPFGAREISEADRDLHGLPGSSDYVPPKPPPVPIAKAPAIPNVEPSPPLPPVDVITIPSANSSAPPEPKLPASILPDDETDNKSRGD